MNSVAAAAVSAQTSLLQILRGKPDVSPRQLSILAEEVTRNMF